MSICCRGFRATEPLERAALGSRATGAASRQPRRALWHSGLLLLCALLPGEPARPAAASPGAQGAGETAIYRHVDTWEARPWEAEAGRFARAGDLTVLSDGRYLLVDQVHNALHVLDAGGRALALWPVHAGDPGARALRIDADPEGGLWLLSWRAGALGQPTSQLDHLDGAGQVLGSWRDPRPFGDLAVDARGRVYVTVVTDQPRVLRLGGAAEEELSFGRAELQYPSAIDVDQEGRVYVVNRVLASGPGDAATATPGPAPTREPSAGARSAPRQDATATPEPAGIEGVLVFGPDRYLLERAVAISAAGDVATGPAGTFVSRELEILPLDAPDRPRFSLAYPSLVSSLQAGPALHVEVPPTGLAASLWHCYFQGLLRFEDAAAGDPRLSGGIDRPLLAGPAYPRRIAAGRELAVLQGRFAMMAGEDGGFTYHPAEISLESEPQSVQRWDAGGALVDQLGVCAGHPNAPAAAWAQDLAADGPVIYTLDPAFLRKRASASFPEWSFWPGGIDNDPTSHRLEALDAAAGRIDYLDLGSREIATLSESGQLVGREAIDRLAAGAGLRALPVDLALSRDGTRFVADAGSKRLLIDGPGGAQDLALHDLPHRVAAGPAGSVFVLGRGGMAYRYAVGGSGQHRLTAAWPMPESGPEPLDIAAGDDGRVFVSFAQSDYLRLPRGNAELGFVRAGTWVFEPASAPESPQPAPGACVLAPDKWASPGRITLGEAVDVNLSARGDCPGARAPIDLALVIDNSRSMAWDGALERAREAAIELLQALDPARDRVVVVSFAEGGALAPLALDDPQAAAAWIAALEPGGDTRVSEAIDLATTALAEPGGRKVLLLLTDAGFRDDPRAAAQRALDAGIRLEAWIFRTADFPGLSLAAQLTAGDRARLRLDPDTASRRDWLDTTSGWTRPETLLERATVVDRIPSNMRYVAGSARPAARYDAGAHSLTWQHGPLAANTALTMSYQLRPLETGLWPTNIDAQADYVDGLGAPGRLVFPLPEVEVIAPPAPRARIYLPLVARAACLKSVLPLDLVLAVDTSQSMAGPAEGGGSKLDAARRAAGGLVDRLDLGTDRVAVVGFDDHATVALGLSDVRGRIDAALTGLASAPGTRLDLGLRAARAVLRSESRPGARPVVILLTDGLHGGQAIDVLLEAELLRRDGSLLYTIGLGAEIDRALLVAIAQPPGAFFASPSAEDLAAVYQAILERVPCDAPPGDMRERP